jgi:thioredoxin-dependent peroxiredoxin
MLKIKDKAPNFKLLDQDGVEHELKNYLGKKVLLYFYPKDDTPGCTTEACDFRDFRYDLQDRGVEIIGMSKDSVKSHRKFADKHKLNFTLLSDESTEVIKSYEAWGTKKFMGKIYDGILRISYLIDERGYIEKVYGDVNTKTHAEEVMGDVK